MLRLSKSKTSRSLAEAKAKADENCYNAEVV